jgi:hypothetical protein
MARAGVVAVVLLHFGFIAYVALGGFLTWRWPRTAGLHAAAVVWGASTLAFGVRCPLTEVENVLRHVAGLPLLGPEGFAGHYLAYESHRTAVRAAFATLVAVSWLGLLRGWGHRRRPAVVKMVR